MESNEPQRHEMTLKEAIAFGTRHHQGGRLAEAEHIYRKILEAYPNQPDAAHFLGVVSHQLGRTDEAIELLEALLLQCPEHVDLHNNIGRIYKDVGRFEEARDRFEFATEAAPDRPDLWNNLGTAYRSLRDLQQSAKCYRKAVELDPRFADAYVNLGNLLHQAGQEVEAAEVYRTAIALKPDESASYHNLSQALHRSGRTEEARDVIREWLTFQPENSTALHLAGALGIRTPPKRASDTFVSQHFDEHATSFDEHLRELEYRAPELIGAVVSDHLGTPTRTLRILDAGCGTGLCGPFLRAHAGQLDGVDLSAGMIAKARGRGEYDALFAQELTQFLNESDTPYDVITCADTLCYFGELEDACLAAASALRKSGLFVFTVEASEKVTEKAAAKVLGKAVERTSTDDSPQWTDPDAPSAPAPDHQLRFHGRYCHSEEYVRRCLERSGFGQISSRSEVLRMETAQPVHGWLFFCFRA